MDHALVKFFVGDGFLLRQLCVPSRKDRGAYLLKNVVPVDGSYHFIIYQLPSEWTVSLPAYKNQKYATSANAVHERRERREHHVVRDTLDAEFAASGLLLYKLVDFHAGHHGRSRASRFSMPLSPGGTANGSSLSEGFIEMMEARDERTLQEREAEARRQNLAKIRPSNPGAVALAQRHYIVLHRSRATNACRFPNEIPPASNGGGERKAVSFTRPGARIPTPWDWRNLRSESHGSLYQTASRMGSTSTLPYSWG